jgi:hypothetical protein
MRWVQEGYSLRQLCTQSHWSQSKLKQIKTYWLAQQPPVRPLIVPIPQYFIFDGTYFSHDYCLMVLWDARSHRPCASYFCQKENYHTAHTWFSCLKHQGIDPVSITMDGHIKVVQAIHDVWPTCMTQRCLYHIQRQGSMWLRRFPRLVCAQELKRLLYTLSSISSHHEQRIWWKTYQHWKQMYAYDIQQLRSQDKVESDIIRTYRMIDHAYQDMFWYLCDTHIPSTSNALEGFFSRLKKHYRNHAGLRKYHLQNYLLWYVYVNS